MPQSATPTLMPTHMPCSPRHCLHYSPLCVGDTEEVIAALYQPQVFEFIGGLPSREDFILDLHTSMAGPPPERLDEQWHHFAVRLANTGPLIGRLEATLHNGLAEVGCLYSPSVWGQGYATQGLHWLHTRLREHGFRGNSWAAVHPHNVLSSAVMQCTPAALRLPSSAQPGTAPAFDL